MKNSIRYYKYHIISYGNLLALIIHRLVVLSAEIRRQWFLVSHIPIFLCLHLTFQGKSADYTELSPQSKTPLTVPA